MSISSSPVFMSDVCLNALDWMEVHMREMEKRDYARTWGTVRQGLIASIHMSDVKKTVMLEGEVMAIFGVTRDYGDGHQPWLALTEPAVQHPAKIVRGMKVWVQTFLKDYQYLSNLVPVEDEVAVDLLEVVGFTIDRDTVHERAGAQYYEFFAFEGDV